MKREKTTAITDNRCEKPVCAYVVIPRYFYLTSIFNNRQKSIDRENIIMHLNNFKEAASSF